jgi:predicted HNH restriction endonuclease
MAEKRTYKERKQYLIKAVQRRREKVRLMAVNYKGGRCQVCRYDRCLEALEFHHLDSTKKDFGISKKGYTRSWEKVKAEADKCVLLCANCHREVHAGILQLPQATVVEKLGEFRETCSGESQYGNPERSLLKGL